MRLHWMAAAGLALVAAVAGAKLPPPTPEQQQTAAAAKEKAAANAEKQKQLLERAQDRVVEYYKRHKAAPGASAANAGRTETTNIPNAATVPAGEAGPKGGVKQSAEAHSAPAK